MLKLLEVSRFEFHPESIDLSWMVRVIAAENQKNEPDRIVDVTVQEGILSIVANSNSPKARRKTTTKAKSMACLKSKTMLIKALLLP